MKQRISTILTISLMVVALGVFSRTLYRSVIASNSEDAISVPAPTKPISAADPKILTIPSLSITAPVESVGLNAKGAMAVPAKFSNVGWFNQGPRPGEGGNAVIDGHINNGLGLSGVFADLETIELGADIFIEDAAGQKIHFKVSRAELVDYKKSGADIFTGDTTRSQLILITCEGDWIQSEKTYNKRFIVYADFVDNQPKIADTNFPTP
jgi:sortase A